MALFGKKSDAPDAPKPPKAPKAAKPPKAPKAPGGKIGFGKKKGAPDAATPLVPGDTVDLTDFAEEQAAAPVAPPPPPKPRKMLKNGTVVGLNIGQHTIKAVEVTAKGGALTVTGLGEVSTPAESIANGVVMNTTALVSAGVETFRHQNQKSGVLGFGNRQPCSARYRSAAHGRW
jgi:hypothetical protein